MNRIGSDIVLEGEVARNFFSRAFNPPMEEIVRSEEILRNLTRKGRMIESTASRTVFEIDNDLLDTAAIFSDVEQGEDHMTADSLYVPRPRRTLYHPSSFVFEDAFAAFDSKKINLQGRDKRADACSCVRSDKLECA